MLVTCNLILTLSSFSLLLAPVMKIGHLTPEIHGESTTERWESSETLRTHSVPGPVPLKKPVLVFLRPVAGYLVAAAA